MLEAELIRIVFYKYTIQASGIVSPVGENNLPQSHRNTEGIHLKMSLNKRQNTNAKFNALYYFEIAWVC